MENIMFRYLENYVGKYRVLPELDLDTNDVPRDERGCIDSTYDDLYIPCKRGYIKNTAEAPYLCWFSDTISVGKNVKKEFEERKIPIYKYDEFSSEVLIWFEDKYMSKVASIVKPKTNGKNIKPFSKRNLKQSKETVFYNIPKSDLDQYTDILKGLSKSEKMTFVRNSNKTFNRIVETIKGKSYNVKEEQIESRLSYKEFIHSINLWKEYIEYLKDEYEKLYK